MTGMTQRIVINDYIVADPHICHGKPIFKGTRIMVWQILDMIKSGEKTQDILTAFPDLKAKAIYAALDYAVSLTKGEKNIIVSLPA